MLNFFNIFQIQTLYVILGMVVVLVALLALLIVLLVKLHDLKGRLDDFTKGKRGVDLENLVTTRFEEVDQLKDADRKKSKHLKNHDSQILLAYSKTGIVKYDAFNEMGGKLSFALCVLDNRNNGYIINAMHSREGCYTYIKEIVNGESYITLGEEEKKALDKALNREPGEE